MLSCTRLTYYKMTNGVIWPVCTHPDYMSYLLTEALCHQDHENRKECYEHSRMVDLEGLPTTQEGEGK